MLLPILGAPTGSSGVVLELVTVLLTVVCLAIDLLLLALAQVSNLPFVNEIAP